MTFSALEALLLGAFASGMVAVFIRGRSVSTAQCDRTQEKMLAVVEQTQERLYSVIESLKISNDIQFKMLRAIVAHLDLTPREKAEILNMGPTKQRND